jgi:hypothetical protein
MCGLYIPFEDIVQEDRKEKKRRGGVYKSWSITPKIHTHNLLITQTVTVRSVRHEPESLALLLVPYLLLVPFVKKGLDSNN